MFEIDAYISEEIFAEFFCFLNLLWLRARNMQVHWFIGLLTSAVLHKTTTAAFDLDTASGLLLDMLDVCTALTYDLSS